DGLQRLVTRRDRRGFAWQHAYSSRDLLFRVKRDDNIYGPASPGAKPPSREDEGHYDALGRLREKFHNGLVGGRVNLAPFGLVRSSTAVGEGIFETTYDLEGMPLWTRDSAGETVVTERASTRQRTETRIRGATGGDRFTTSTIDDFDASGLGVARTL